MAKEKKLADNVTAEEAKTAEKKVGTSALAVYNANGAYVRTYSAEEHGEGFQKLAEMYSGKIGGTVRKA